MTYNITYITYNLVMTWFGSVSKQPVCRRCQHSVLASAEFCFFLAHSAFLLARPARLTFPVWEPGTTVPKYQNNLIKLLGNTNIKSFYSWLHQSHQEAKRKLFFHQQHTLKVQLKDTSCTVENGQCKAVTLLETLPFTGLAVTAKYLR